MRGWLNYFTMHGVKVYWKILIPGFGGNFGATG
jgi:hypothetical protein